MTIASLSAGAPSIHIFRTDIPPGTLAALERLLSPAELERAGRFQFEADRARFVASRGALRTILAGYLATPPRDLEFAAGVHGKPTVRGGQGVRFSLSRSRNLCLVAVRRGADVGVDLEAVRPVNDALSIAKSRFSPAEAQAIDSDESFFALWTRKEAVAKCLGWGLSLPFDVFEVPAPVSPDPQRVVVAYEGARSVHWLQPVPLDEAGYVASIATEGEESPVRVAQGHPDRHQERDDKGGPRLAWRQATPDSSRSAKPD